MKPRDKDAAEERRRFVLTLAVESAKPVGLGHTAALLDRAAAFEAYLRMAEQDACMGVIRGGNMPSAPEVAAGSAVLISAGG